MLTKTQMARGKRTGGGRPRAGPEEIRFDPRVKAIEQWGDEEAMEAGGEDACTLCRKA